MPTSWHLTTLTVLGGPRHGTKHSIEDVVVEVLVGSDPDCHLHIDLPTVSPIHARLWIEPDDVTVYGTRSGPGVYIGVERVDGEGKLHPGDMLWLGPPQEAGSVMVQARFEERDSLPPALVSAAVPGEEAAEAPSLTLSADSLGLDDPARESSDALAADPIDEQEEELAPIPVASVEDAAADAPAVEGASTTGPAMDEELGVLPEDTPTPLEIALRRDAVASEGPAGTASAEPEEPVSSPERSDVEDFLIMAASPGADQQQLPSRDQFLVSGFETEWSGAFEPPPGAEIPPAPADSPPPAPAPASDEDLFFFVAGTSGTAVPSPAEDPFYFDDSTSATAAAVAEPPAEPAPALSPPEPMPPLDLTPAAPATAFPAIHAAPPPAKRAPSSPAAPAPPPVSGAPPSRSAGPSPAASPTPVRRPGGPGSTPRADRGPTPRPDRTQPARPLPRPASRTGPYLAMGAGALVVLGLIAFGWRSLTGSVRLDSIEPVTARVGDTLAITGQGFSRLPGANSVLFGDTEAKVTASTATRLDATVPDILATAGQNARVPVRVRVGRSVSKPLEMSITAGPSLNGISPDVAMPGDEVVLTGSGWGPGPAVRFGGVAAEILTAVDVTIRVKVPAIAGGPGTAAPVVVSAGALESNPAPFFVGRIPLILKAEPTTGAPGDVVTLTGRGFRRERTQNAVHVGGVRALVLTAFDNELALVIPPIPAGSRMLELRVPGSEVTAQASLTVTEAPAVGLRFVAEPFEKAPERDYAVLATRLGPAFLLASSNGKSAAERAVAAARRFDAAGSALAASPGLNVELRDADTNPVLAIVGRPEMLLDVTEEDAVAYGEDWTGLRRGGPVTRGRVARWWEAVARDLVLLLAHGERPRFAAQAAPEGRVFLDLYQAAHRPGGTGTTAALVLDAHSPLREALRVAAFRVPPSVGAPAAATTALEPLTATPLATPASSPMPRLDGSWSGSESEGGRQRYVTVTFRGTTGMIAYEGVVTVSTPLLTVQQPQRGSVRFSVEVRGGLRYYAGHWDGQAVVGTIATDPSGGQKLGTFELRPR